ncbi:MAG: exodeoxyribonuclease VII small subunit [Bacteroidota bacterium]|nr:exodeoxyribonuclease VII small subunit [Bacteroidota bacterium]
MEKKDLSYTKAVQEIESIIDQIEEGKMDMDALSRATKRALELIKFCKVKLRSTESDIDKMLEDISD